MKQVGMPQCCLGRAVSLYGTMPDESRAAGTRGEGGSPSTLARRRFQIRACAAMVVLATAWCATAAMAQWPQWGGPHQNFHADANGLVTSWADGCPKTNWKRELGDGYSAISVDDGRLYTMFRRDDDEVVTALDAATGKTVWEFAYAAPFTGDMQMEFGPGPHSTPLIANGRVFTIGVTGKFLCLDASSGKVLWAHELIAEYNSSSLGRGYGASPAAYQKLVIVPIGGGPDAAIMAFDQGDGHVVWRRHDFALTYASPLVVKFEGKDQIIAFMGKEVTGLEPLTGELLWSHPHQTQYDANISTPVWQAPDTVFTSSAYQDGGSRAIRLKKVDGKIVPEELWFGRKLRSHFGNSVIVGDYMYGSSGDFGPAMLMAVNLRTGEVAWRERGFAKANVLYADGKLLVLDEDGKLALTTATPEKLTVLGTCELLARNAWTVPTVIGKTMYVRDRKHIMSLDLG